MHLIESQKDAHHQDWLWDNVELERHFYIVILGYPLKHGYDSWKMVSHGVFEWKSEGCTPPRLIVGPSILNLKGALHRMNIGDKMKIIDDANAFLFTICFNKLRGTIKKNIEHTTMSLLLQAMRCMSKRLDSSLMVPW